MPAQHFLIFCVQTIPPPFDNGKSHNGSEVCVPAGFLTRNESVRFNRKWCRKNVVGMLKSSAIPATGLTRFCPIVPGLGDAGDLAYGSKEQGS